MAACSTRARHFMKNRSLRGKTENDENVLTFDHLKDPLDTLKEIISNIISVQGVNKGKKLCALNHFVKLWKKDLLKLKDISIEAVLCCLRVSLIHEAREIRAAGLRAVRYTVQDHSIIPIIKKFHIHHLIIRSLDISLENQMERLQAIRLIRKIFHINPKNFPKAFINCLVAIASDDHEEPDQMLQTCLATLCEIIILNPHTYGSVDIIAAILRNVLVCQQPRISEALMGSILYLLNHPQTRIYVKPNICLEQIVAPFTDCHYSDPKFSGDEEEEMFTASKLAILSTLRSWPGLIRLCKPGDSGLQTLVDILYLPHPDVRNGILEIIFEVFRLPIPDRTEDFTVALLACDSVTMQESWKLFDGFIVEEGLIILPYLGCYRPNLVENYLCLILLAFISNGILEALVEVIVSSDTQLSIKATVLLGELLHLANTRLPNECSHHSHCLPSLISLAASSNASPKCRYRANAAVSFLNRLHAFKRRGLAPCSLFLDQLMHFSSMTMENYNNKWQLSQSKLLQYLTKDLDDLTIQSIKDSSMCSSKSPLSWDWELIRALLKCAGETFKKLEDANHKQFIRKLVNFFKPTSKQFSCIEQSEENFQKIAQCGCHLIDFFVENNNVESTKFFEEFLTDFQLCISQVTMENMALDHIFSPHRLMSTLSQYYFLFIGRASHSLIGRKFLEQTGTLQCLLTLISTTNHDVYAKLVISCLDYSQEGVTRVILTKVLTATSVSSRLYATNFMRILVRLRIPDFSQWGIEFLVTQLYDRQHSISLAAMDILDEACNEKANLEALINLRPSLLHLGERGQLLLIRFLSLPSGFKFLSAANYLKNELEKWQKSFNRKYVKIVESELYDALTRHQRGEDGKYQRRSNQRHAVKNVYVPAHLYGQLAQHKEGIDLLIKMEIIDHLIKAIHLEESEIDSTSEEQILNLKASLWALGHIGTSESGIVLLNNEQIIQCIVKLAEESSIFSIRGTCFYVLGLLATTQPGADILRQLGWEALRHHREEIWPTVEEQDISNSVSSDNSYLCDIDLDMFSSNSSSRSSLDEIIIRSRTFHGTQDDSFIDRNDLNIANSKHLHKFNGNISEELILDDERISALTQIRNRKEKSCTLPCPSRSRSMIPFISTDTAPFPFQKNLSISSKIRQQMELPETSSSANEHCENDNSLHSSTEFPSKPQIKVLSKERNRSCSFTNSSSSGNNSYTHVNKLRSISNIEIVQSSTFNDIVTKEERSDSNESKSRSDSCTDSTSGIGSCDSGTGRFGITDHAQTLSPIPSSTSLNTMSSKTVHHSDSTRKLVNLRHTPLIFHRYPSVPRSQLSPEFHPFSPFVYTTTRDAIGYATLRTIQQHRNSTTDFEYKQYHRRCIQKTRSLEDSTAMQRFCNEFLRPTILQKQQLSHTTSSQIPKCQNEGNRYMGICLPIDVAMIFHCDEKVQKTQPAFLNDLQENQQWGSDVADHLEETCIKCSQSLGEEKSSSLFQSPTSAFNMQFFPDTRDPANQSSSSVFYSCSPSTEIHPTLLPVVSYSETLTSTPGSISSMDSMDFLSQKGSESGGSGLVLIRKEILRFIICLGSTIGMKSAEQGLLCLKQKFPKAFQDLCIYSDVSNIMSDYKLCLFARRFIQELFLDMDFHELHLDASILLNISTVNRNQANGEVPHNKQKLSTTDQIDNQDHFQ